MREQVEREMERVDELGARYLFLGQGLYPALLAQIESAPPALIVKGDLGLLERPAIAMVGARNASAAACRFARTLAQGLGEDGALVVSGLARGIDSAAHDGSLETGTAGVIAGGIDVVYPPENEARQSAVARRGLLIAEQPPGTEPRARHFPIPQPHHRRLAQGTVVVEAAPKSGSLITARYAAEFGRDVMAVPGSPLDPRAQGCNQLIREGAILVQNAADVLETVRPYAPRAVAEPQGGLRVGAAGRERRDRRLILDLLSPTAVPVDEIIRQSGLPPCGGADRPAGIGAWRPGRAPCWRQGLARLIVSIGSTVAIGPAYSMGMKRLVLLALLILAAVVAFFAWSQREARLRAERELGLAASRTVAESFSKGAAIKVGTLRGQGGGARRG
jgi:DNA processing protein